MNSKPHILASVVLGLLIGLTGCSVLKPTKSVPRRYVLTAMPSETAPGPGGIGVGVGQVRVPSYLANSSIAIRRGTNEMDYPPLVVWAERLDNGIQRVLAANLATLLPTDHVRLSAWSPGDAAAEVYVTIQQFDVDATGKGVLTAFWRVRSPGREKVLDSSETRLTKSGPAPDPDPSGAVNTLSELLADFSRQLADVIKPKAQK
jgi:uncharacterized lipoprotein YmbA